MKIGFYVSRKATRLKKFLRYIGSSKKELVPVIDFVVSDNLEDFELKAQCDKLGIPFFFLDNTSFKQKNLLSSDYICELMERRNTDYLFIYCDAILRGKLIERFTDRIINFHPSLLPAHRGLHAIDQGLAAKSFLFGNSAHFVDAGIDTGKVIMQSVFSFANYQDYDQVLDMQIPMITQLFLWLMEGRVYTEDGYAKVKNANYTAGAFIPNIEFEYR